MILIKLSLSLEQSNTSGLKGQIIRVGYQTDQSTDPASPADLPSFNWRTESPLLTPAHSLDLGEDRVFAGAVLRLNK